MENKILKIFREVLKIEGDVKQDSLQYNETKNWDSLNHMKLVMLLEQEFDFMMDPDDILAMSDFQKALEIVLKNAK